MVDNASEILLHELQLGNQLNQCVSHSLRQSFSLLLTLLSEDVADQSQFHLQRSTTEEVEWGTYLRDKWQPGPEQPLRPQTDSADDAFVQASFVASERNLHDARLLHCLRPQPFTYKETDTVLPEVKNELSVSQQLRCFGGPQISEQRLDDLAPALQLAALHSEGVLV